MFWWLRRDLGKGPAQHREGSLVGQGGRLPAACSPHSSITGTQPLPGSLRKAPLSWATSATAGGSLVQPFGESVWGQMDLPRDLE